jgi:TonB family protein
MRGFFPFCARAISLIIACIVFTAGASADIKEDRMAFAQRVGTEIASHSFKKLYVADFLDTLGVRIDKGCYFASVFSTSLAEQKQGFAVVNRIDGQRMLTKAEFITVDLPKLQSPTKVGADTGVDVLVMGTFQQNLSSMVLDISLKEVASGKEVFRAQYQENATDEFEALFPAALDPTGTIYFFPGLDGVGHPKCVTCPPPAAATPDGQKSAADQLLSAVFRANGKLGEARIVRSADPTADQAVLEALKDWKVEPAKDASGAAVPVRHSIRVGSSSSDSGTVPRAGVNGVTSPQCVHCPPPEYSDDARKSKSEGAVLLDVTVLPDGRVADIVVLKTPTNDLGAKAVKAVKSWNFKPALDKAGKPVACRVNIQVTQRTLN